MAKRQLYNTYTEVDTAGRLTITADTIQVNSLDTDETAYLNKDFGINFFDADFEHNFEFSCTVSTGNVVTYLWGMSNENGAIGETLAGNSVCLSVHWNGAALVLSEGTGAAVHTTAGAVTLAKSTSYYVRMYRDETVGTYGTLYCYIYNDCSCIDLVEVMVLTLHVKTNFRYAYAVSSAKSAVPDTVWSGYVRYLNLEYNPHTLANMLGLCRFYLRDVTAHWWSDAELTSYINIAIRDIAMKTGCVQHLDSVVTSAGSRWVNYSGYKVIAVEYKPVTGRRRYLRNITMTQLGHVAFGTTNSEPEFWFEDTNRIGIDPIPNGVYSLDLYVADYVDAALTLNSQVPQVPVAFRSLIVKYCLFEAFMKDKKLPQAMFIYALYNSDLTYHTMDKVMSVPMGERELRG